jgi:hypothetical protein
MLLQWIYIHLSISLAGSAANFIEKKMKKLGPQIIAPHKSAMVFDMKEKERGAKLKQGEEKRFEKIGID